MIPHYNIVFFISLDCNIKKFLPKYKVFHQFPYEALRITGN